MKLVIGGDIVPTEKNMEMFVSGDADSLIDQRILDKIKSADFVAFNLEVPLSNEWTPISKCGPNLIAKEESINLLKKINPHFYTLANNHILDQGEKGLFKTIEILNSNNISYCGAGENLEEAKKPFIKTIGNKRVGFYCCAEHEFSIASDTSGGANPFDPLESFDDIVSLCAAVDILIVLYHGGKEHYRYPSPQLQRICRKFVEKGADLVICQHSHCIGCKEQWKQGTIIYGQGNFFFDYMTNEFWETSLLIELNIDDNALDITYIPIFMEQGKLRLAEGKRKEEILSEFYKRSHEILVDGFVDKCYMEFAHTMQWEYFSAFAGKIRRNIIFRIINKLSGYKFAPWYLNKRYGKQQRLQIQNYVECEAHRELLIEGMKQTKNTWRKDF